MTISHSLYPVYFSDKLQVIPGRNAVYLLSIYLFLTSIYANTNTAANILTIAGMIPAYTRRLLF